MPTIRIATLNAENLFRRASVMNLNTWADGREVLNDVARLNELLSRKEYKGATKTAIKKLLDKYEFWNRKKTDRPFDIREVREKLFKVPKGKKAVEIVAKGRGDWVGWVELRRDEISSGAVVNTGRVIDAVGPQLLCMIEVDDRIALDRFNTLILDQEFGRSFRYNMLVDGNDPRRIDIGFVSQHEIVSVRSHIHDRDGGPDLIFNKGTNQKLDYILLSPVLFAKVQRVGVERRGVYAPKTHASFPEVTSAQTSASDHACVWVDLDLS